jgi:hypothetical protein
MKYLKYAILPITLPIVLFIIFALIASIPIYNWRNRRKGRTPWEGIQNRECISKVSFEEKMVSRAKSAIIAREKVDKEFGIVGYTLTLGLVGFLIYFVIVIL